MKQGAKTNFTSEETQISRPFLVELCKKEDTKVYQRCHDRVCYAPRKFRILRYFFFTLHENILDTKVNQHCHDRIFLPTRRTNLKREKLLFDVSFLVELFFLYLDRLRCNGEANATIVSLSRIPSCLLNQ
mmetsp:Transcript_21052/g.29711  ORF Transcript_21052/g.29711 Transcript_21052/m.29711 type:complete len:130 (+) Transcript_21052:1873-2262(+)